MTPNPFKAYKFEEADIFKHIYIKIDCICVCILAPMKVLGTGRNEYLSGKVLNLYSPYSKVQTELTFDFSFSLCRNLFYTYRLSRMDTNHKKKELKIKQV